jgi:hypothetical protein
MGPGNANRPLRLLGVGLVLVWAGALSGCGGSGGGPAYGSADGDAIAERVESLSGDTTDDKALASHFAKGSAPRAEELRQFRQYTFSVAENPAVAGDTATAKVQLAKADSGEETGTAQWTFVKEGNDWKVKTAPLR